MSVSVNVEYEFIIEDDFISYLDALSKNKKVRNQMETKAEMLLSKTFDLDNQEAAATYKHWKSLQTT